MFRIWLKTKTLSSPWKHTLVKSILQKGHCCKPSNYSPIILIIVFQVFEFLNSHILKHLEPHRNLFHHGSMSFSQRDLPVISFPMFLLSGQPFWKMSGDRVSSPLSSRKLWIGCGIGVCCSSSSLSTFLYLCSVILSLLSGWSISINVDGSTLVFLRVPSCLLLSSSISPTISLQHTTWFTHTQTTHVCFPPLLSHLHFLLLDLRLVTT